MRPLSVFTLLSVFLVAPAALAQSDAAKAQALKLFQEGITLHDQYREEEAYLRFKEAFAVVQTPPLLLNLARTEQLTGRHLAAVEHYRAYLALPEHPRVTPALRTLVRGYLTELDVLLGHLVIEAPPGAVLTVDGKELPRADTKVEVEPGSHTVAGKLGEQQGFLNVVAVAGGVTPVHLMLIGGAPPPVAVVPVPVVTPLVVPPEPPPTHPTKTAYWNGRRTAGVVVAGVGAVGLVLGGVFGAQRGSDTSNAMAAAAQLGGGTTACFQSTSAGCMALSSALQSNGSAATLETAFFIGGGVLLAAGVVTTLWPASQSSSSPSPSALVPYAGPHGGGLQWTGSF
jgi:hypothetical protein